MKQTAPLEIGLSVTDLPKMLSFYVDVFGCEEVRRAEIPAELSQKIKVAPEGYLNVWLRFPGGEIIKLMRPSAAPERQPSPEYAATVSGLGYFTLYCDDIAGAIGQAESAGATLVSDPALAGAEAPVKLAFLTDPEGNLFEFVQA